MATDKNLSVSFASNHFNRSDQKDYFINPSCFGDDLASWLMAALRTQNIEVEDDSPDQEDFGWYLNFEIQKSSYSCVILYQEDCERWLCILEYNAGLVGSIFGKRKKPVPEEVAQIFDQILQSEPDIFQKVEWSNRT